MALKYSVVLNVLTTGDKGCSVWEYPQLVLETIAAAGYDGVDMDAEPDRVDAVDTEKFAIWRSLGLKVPALLGAWAPWHCGEERDLCSTDESVRAAGVAYAKRSVDLATDVFEDPPLFQLCACPLKNEYPLSSTPIDTLRRQFIRSATEIVEYTAPKKVNIAIEPVNKFEAHPGYLNTIAEAMDVIETIGSDNLGIQADFYHMNMADGDLAETLKMIGGKLMHIHLAESNRITFGTGHLDFPRIARTLKEIDFNGYLSMDSVPAYPDWKTAVQQAIRYMKHAEQASA